VPLVELFTIEGTFWINQNGVQMLILRPIFRVPPGGWRSRTESVGIVTPDGRELSATAQISMTHLNISDPNVPIEERWPITIWLTDRTKDEVPVGSRVLVSEEIKKELLPQS
jgi:hypothetical protein